MSDPVEPPEEARPTQSADPGSVVSGGASSNDDDKKAARDGNGANVGVHHSKIGYQFIAENLVLQVEAERFDPTSASARPTGGEAPQGTAAPKRTEGTAPSKRRYLFEDPTLPFPPPVGAPKYRLEEGEAGQWSRRLDESRLIAVRSPDDGLTSAAVHSLLAFGGPRPHQIRLLAFGQKNQGRGDLFLENLVAQQLGEPDRPTILVVDTHGALPFIESTFGGEDWARAMSAALRSEDDFVILKIAAAYRDYLESKFDSFNFPCWSVDFLRPLLRRYFSLDQVPSLAERIEKQRRAGLWGPRGDDAYLLDALLPLVSGPRGGLEAELEARERSAGPQPNGQRGRSSEKSRETWNHGQAGGGAGGEPGQVVSPSLEAFESRVPYYQGILICAAYFRGLDVTEFARVAFGLVGDEYVFVAEGELTAEGRAELRQQRRRLRDAWPRIGDDILKNCGLTVRTADGRSSVAFARPGDRAAVQERVRNSIYFSEVSETLWEAGHLFDPSASQELVDGTTAMFVEALAHHRDWRQPQWLCDTLVARLSPGESQDLGGLLRSIASDSLVISRLSQLLHVLVGSDGHLDLVQSWLGHLISRRGHLPALQLATHLRYAEGFNYLFWLKRLSDESPDEIRNIAYSALYAQARQSSVRIWEFFDELEGWLPEPTRTASTLSNSNSFALQLIIEYSVDTAEAMPAKEYGGWPSRYPLFRGLAQDSDSAATRLRSLVSWLFHPAIGAVFRENGADLVWVVRARLLELWSCVLLGLDGDGAHPEAETTYRRLLAMFWERTDRDDRHRLITIWRRNRERLEQERRHSTREASRLFARRIEGSVRLERDFKLLFKTGSSEDQNV